MRSTPAPAPASNRSEPATAPPAVADAGHGLPPSARRRAAVLAGWSYVALFVLAVGVNLVVLEAVVVDGDPSATLGNVLADPWRVRLAVVGFVAVAVLDVVIAVALHRLLRPVHAVRSAWAAASRAVYAGLLAVAVVSLARVPALASGPDAAGQVDAALATFDRWWLVGLAVFGVHLVLVASLLGGPARAHMALRVLLAVAGAAYVLDTVLLLTAADPVAVEAITLPFVAVPSMLGEGWFAVHLLRRAGREDTVVRA